MELKSIDALRHAHAKKIEVRLNWSKFYLEIFVEDDGTGFDFPDQKNKIKNRQGLGLINIESRVNILGAQLSYENNSPSGTIVNIKLKASHDG